MRLVIFSGTSEGRRLSHALAARGIPTTVCVATEYGREEQGSASGITVRTGRLDTEGMTALLAGAAACVDATHPYAKLVSENLRAACRVVGLPYLRLLRAESELPEGCRLAADAAEACRMLLREEGNILLTTGAKELAAFAPLGGERLFPRVLPLHDSLTACEAAGVPHANILAMQGPFSQELNEAILRQYRIRWMVTKDGGRAGGFAEKAAAAAAVGAGLVVIRRPADAGADYETIFAECCRLAAEREQTCR